jgi:hypothetical protein
MIFSSRSRSKSASAGRIGALFEIEGLGSQALAGFAEPQRAWRVIGESGVLNRFEALRSERRTTARSSR